MAELPAGPPGDLSRGVGLECSEPALVIGDRASQVENLGIGEFLEIGGARSELGDRSGGREKGCGEVGHGTYTLMFEYPEQ